MADIDAIRKKITEKIESGEFSREDLENYFIIFCEIGRKSEDFQDEIEGWDRNIVFDLCEAGMFWISTVGGNVSTGIGGSKNVDLTLKMNIENVLKIFSGELDPGLAFMTGKLKLKGELPDALKFSELMEIVADEIESN